MGGRKFTILLLAESAMMLTIYARAIAFVYVAVAVVVPSAAVEVQVAPSDSPIKINGKIGDDSTFVKRISLIAPAEAVAELIFYPGELTSSAGNVIPASQITIINPTKIELVQNTPRAIDIKIAGVKVPGTYKGNLSFLQPGQGFKPVVKVPIEVTAQVFPPLVLRKSAETVKIQVIDCGRLNCWMARTLQPSAFNPVYPVDFDNNGLNDYNIVLSTTGQGETTHIPLGDILRLPAQVTIAPSPIYTLRIGTALLSTSSGGTQKNAMNSQPSFAANPQALKVLPDRYSGILQLNPPGNEMPIKIPVEVDVRSGPFWPLVVLIVGIFIGRLLKYMKDKGGPQSDLLLRYYQLDARISQQPADAHLLQTAMAAVKGRIYDMELDGAKADLDTIQNRWNVLSHLREVETTLSQYTGNPGVPAIVQNIRRARDLVSQAQDTAVAALVQQIDSAVRDLAAPPGAPGQVATAYRSAATFAAKARTAAAAATTAPAKAPWYVRLLGSVTGMSNEVRAEGTLWLARPLVYVLLVIALVLVGISQLYLKNPVFGADPLADYFGLAVWATSSDVASRSLTSLKLGS